MTSLGIVLLVAAHAADYVTFLAMVKARGIAAEANPIVADIAARGLALLTVAKVASVLFMVCVVVMVGRRRPFLAAATAVVGIGFGLLAALSNIASF